MATKKKADKKKTKKAVKKGRTSGSAVPDIMPLVKEEYAKLFVESVKGIQCPNCSKEVALSAVKAFECLSCGVSFPEKPESTNPSLMYGVRVYDYTDERRKYVDDSSFLSAYVLGDGIIVAVVCLQNLVGPVYTRDVGLSPEGLRDLREFCRKCKVKFQSQWIFTWLGH
jgi:ribosomal protein L37AE/L43A